MKFYFTVLVLTFYTLIKVDGKNLNEHKSNIGTKDDVDSKHILKSSESQGRHRRQTYANNKHIDYLRDMSYYMRDIAMSLKQLKSSDQNTLLYDDTRDNSCDCMEEIRKLSDLVNELVKQANHMPPPPKPLVVYVKYPVFEKPNMNITNKMGEGIDSTFNFPPEFDSNKDDDGSRPVSFKPIPPNRPIVPPPPFDHGSKQEGIKPTTPATLKKPSICEGAILSCCGLQNSEHRECFASYNCSKSYDTGKACHPRIVQFVLDKFSKIYGPSNEF